VIHAAGTVDDALIPSKRQASVEAVFGPKVYGTLALDRVLAKERLDFFLLFSSTSAAIAAAGQVDYVAANAFLKMLEEPSEKTTIILTSSEPGALLPTIRSRAVAVRVPFLTDTAVRAFLADPAVAAALDKTGAPKSVNERAQLASSAPGTLFGGEARGKAMASARKLIDAATAPNASTRHAAAIAVGAAGARGPYTDILDSMIIILGERMRAALHDGNNERAVAASRAADAVGQAKIKAGGNVNPQLITSGLLRELSATLK
jgi:DNA polymerase-3 subunit delta'